MLVKKTLIALGLVGTMLNAHAFKWEKLSNGDKWETTTASSFNGVVDFVWRERMDPFGEYYMFKSTVDCSEPSIKFTRVSKYVWGELKTSTSADYRGHWEPIPRGDVYEDIAKKVCSHFGFKYNKGK